MPKWRLPLSFALFFHAVCKDNTHIPQYDAVNVLLMGETLTGSNSAKITISTTMTSHYISGSKKISKAISSQFLLLDFDERVRRMNNILLQDINVAVYRILHLLQNGNIEMSDHELRHFLSFPFADKRLEFLAELLTVSIRCPRERISKLPDVVIADIRSIDVFSCDTDSDTPHGSENREFTAQSVQRKKSPKILSDEVLKIRQPRDKFPMSEETQSEVTEKSESWSNRSESETLRNQYITDTPKEVYILNDYADEEEVEFYPDRLYVLSLYFIGLSYPNEATGGDPHLVLDHSGYSSNTENDSSAQIWSVPYTQYRIDIGNKKVRAVGEIKEVYEDFLESKSLILDVLEQHKFDELGVFNWKLTRGKEYIEYKRASSEPDKYRCYYIREFFVHNVDSVGIVNLIDPEGLHAHRYLPLSQLELEDFSGMTFLDKPIPQNVAKVILSKEKPIVQLANRVPEDLTRRTVQGTMFVISLEQTRDPLFFHTDTAIAEDEIVQVFNRVMVQNGIALFNATSRRVVGILPTRIPTAVHKKEDFFVLLLFRMVTELRSIFQAYDGAIRLICTVFSGLYQYDRPLYQPSIQFGGAHYLHLFRMHKETVKTAASNTYQQDSVFIGIKEKDLDLIKRLAENTRSFFQNPGPFNMLYYDYRAPW